MPAYSFRGRAKHYVYLILVRFYLWAHLKTVLYSAPIKNEKTRSVVRRVHACIDSDGGHCEDLLWIVTS
jgi:hypothetical protein